MEEAMAFTGMSESNNETRSMGTGSIDSETLGTLVALPVVSTYNKGSCLAAEETDPVPGEIPAEESSSQCEIRASEGSGTEDGSPNGWDADQQMFSQLTQEIKERFSISEANQREIQVTCSSLEAKIGNLTQRTWDLEGGLQDLQTVVQENNQEVVHLKQTARIRGLLSNNNRAEGQHSTGCTAGSPPGLPPAEQKRGTDLEHYLPLLFRHDVHLQ
ncbi:hypothetical protein NDU88_008079 [Pleurodeles waltl]|uniref:Uncharacterized protein n=1 Tax=Pleurodeles waltl TaxID=8319 RepID=A0AAV7NV00_PLEWA|nr:hypothetical protein NDU88_008079 [Pleurodeles waltl]